MKYAKSCVLVLGTVFGAMAGCRVDDDKADNAADAGNAGSAGTAGRAGGSGGSGGAGASSGGRVGGDAGSHAGSSERGGRGGTGSSGAGSGGAGEGGQSGGGEGGACLEEVEQHPLGSSCGSSIESSVLTTCTFEDTCELLRCGEPFSAFDANGCRREECESSDNCGDGERCVAVRLWDPPSCYSAVYEGCEVACDHCTCVVSADCRSAAFCLPAADYPPEDECNLTGLDCEELSTVANYFEWDWDHEGDTADAIEACRSKIDAALDDCPGHGGSGAGGQSGAGGESGGAGQSGAGGQAGGGGEPGG